MRVTVRLFAQLRELSGRGDWAVEIAPDEASGDPSVAGVWRRLVDDHPALAPFGRAVSCAVNAQFARMAAPVRDGDEVAFLPPVSGG
jgi:molybdopterin converting factor small subunit